MTQTLGWFSEPDAPVHFPGAAFLLASALALLCLAVFRWGLRAQPAGSADAPVAPET
jgi:DHA1 family tetracycline resistance protein-like MFS transporter